MLPQGTPCLLSRRSRLSGDIGHGLVMKSRSAAVAAAVLTTLLCARGQGSPENDSSHPGKTPAVVYRNDQYSFCFTLPASWDGFTVVTGSWSGSAPGDSDPTHLIKGPLLRIRNPRWTEEEPYEDIPVMIFTHKQWKAAQSDKMIVSAAPFGPSELAHNSRWVFALPPRYDYDFATGYQEVEKLLGEGRLHAPCKRR